MVPILILQYVGVITLIGSQLVFNCSIHLNTVLHDKYDSNTTAPVFCKFWLVMLALFQNGRQTAQYFLGFKNIVYEAVPSLLTHICHSFH
jgi:hypothetical protein